MSRQVSSPLLSLSMVRQEPSQLSIRVLRETRSLSQEALARLLGVSVRTVTRWETGVSRPSPLALEKLLQTIGQDAGGPTIHGS